MRVHARECTGSKGQPCRPLAKVGMVSEGGRRVQISVCRGLQAPYGSTCGSRMMGVAGSGLAFWSMAVAERCLGQNTSVTWDQGPGRV